MACIAVILQLRRHQAKHVLPAPQQFRTRLVVDTSLSLVEALEGILLVVGVGRVRLDEAVPAKPSVSLQALHGLVERTKVQIREGHNGKHENEKAANGNAHMSERMVEHFGEVGLCHDDRGQEQDEE